MMSMTFKLGRLSNLLVDPIRVLSQRNLLGNFAPALQHLTSSERFYSKKSDKDQPCKPFKDEAPGKDDKCKTIKPDLKGCNFPQRECQTGHKAIPSLQECARPNLMNTLPKPDCPYEAADEKHKKGYKRVLIFGTVLLLATLAVLYYMDLFNKKSPPKKKKVKEKKKKRSRIVEKIPASSSDIPNDVPYLLVGGGTASFSAFRAIKSADPTAKVLVITNEGNFPYMRPPLSKEMWFSDDDNTIKNLNFKQWNGSERSLFYEPSDFYTDCRSLMASENGGVAVARGWSVTHVDVVEKKAYLEDGYAINYNKCLIATGATPRTLNIFLDSPTELQEKVSVYRNIFDFEELYDNVKEAQAVAIIGGGFLGSELACALARKGKGKLKVSQIFRENGNMGKILPEYLSFWTTDKVKNEGVQVVSETEVMSAELSGNAVDLLLNNGKHVSADHVIVAVGVEPNTSMAEPSDLEIDPELGGYLVNTELMARSHLYIAGDCACFYDTKLGRRRVEHHDHAVVSGRLAGENMAGGAKPYLHQSMFWSDLGPDVGYEAIGIVDSALPTVGVFAKATDNDSPKAVVTATDEGIRSKTEGDVPEECKKYAKNDPEAEKAAKEKRKAASAPMEGEDFGKGVIFYLRDDIVVGIVLWNVFNRMAIARQVLKDERKYDDLNEVAKLFNIHEE